MEINGSSSPPRTAAAAPPQLQELRIGQRLEAVVLKQIATDTVLLQLLDGNRGRSAASAPPAQLLATTTQPLSPGERLQLEVSRLGEPPLLKVLAGGPAATPPPSMEATLRAALMQSLPRQGPLTTLLANLAWINQQPGAAALLPLSIQALAKELFERLPGRERVSNAAGLKEALEASGLFLEQKVGRTARHGAPLESGGDLKGLLLRLLASVQQARSQTAPATAGTVLPSPPAITPPLPPAPPLPGTAPQPQRQAEASLATLTTTLAQLAELESQTEGALARLQLHQIRSLPGSEQSLPSWSFELPVRGQERSDLFQITIEEQRRSGGSDENGARSWAITLAFELPPLGPIHARLQLENGRVGTTFWAGTAATTALIRENLADLAQRYRQAGLEDSGMHCYQGQPPERPRHGGSHVALDLKV